jgi:hypothetical protein
MALVTTSLNLTCRVPGDNRCGPLSLIALDRGWGKAAQALETGDNGAFELAHRIERIIVHPENSDKAIEPASSWSRHARPSAARSLVCIREAQRTLAQSSKRLIESKIASLGLGHGFRRFR